MDDSVMFKDVYGITGSFWDKMHRDRITFFGGFFSVESSSKHSMELEGVTFDSYGVADIEGVLSRDLLEFDKRYVESRNTFSYRFEKGDDDIWLGTFGHGGCGTARCKINLDWPRQKIISSRQETDEEMANNLLSMMMPNGHVRFVKGVLYGGDDDAPY